MQFEVVIVSRKNIEILWNRPRGTSTEIDIALASTFHSLLFP